MTEKTLAERIAAIETRCPLREEIIKQKLEGIQDQLKMVDSRLGSIEHVLNNGLRQVVDDHADEIKKHKELLKQILPLLNRNSDERTRATDLSNRKPVVKYSIIVAIVSLVLGNLVTIGYALMKLGELLTHWGGVK